MFFKYHQLKRQFSKNILISFKTHKNLLVSKNKFKIKLYMFNYDNFFEVHVNTNM